MQDVLKKYKDPHIYTAFIKYSSLKSSYTINIWPLLYHTYFKCMHHQNVSGTTWESCLIHSSALHLRGPTNCCIYLRSHNILGASYLLLLCDRRCFFLCEQFLFTCAFFANLFSQAVGNNKCHQRRSSSDEGNWSTSGWNSDGQQKKHWVSLQISCPIDCGRGGNFGNTFVSRQKTFDWFDLENCFEKHNLIFSFSPCSTSCV